MVKDEARKIIEQLPELLADYEHLAADADGKIDPHRKRRIAKLKTQVAAWLREKAS